MTTFKDLLLADETLRDWLASLMSQADLPDRDAAYEALRATLHAIRDRLGPQGALSFGAVFPQAVKDLYFEGWSPLTWIEGNDITAHISHDRPDLPVTIVGDVLMVIAERVGPTLVRRAVEDWPEPLRAMWPIRL